MKDHNSVFIAWRSLKAKSWHVVGLLTENKNGERGSFSFSYTQGALFAKDFIPFAGMNDLYKTYKSEELFPLFKNRLLSTRRPEYPLFIQWLGLDNNDGVINILGRSGGIRGTDSLQMFQRVDFCDDGSFEHVFFAHGLGYLAKEALDRVSYLTKGEQLYLSLDCQNSFDDKAVIIRAETPAQIVGYCPRYLARDITSFLKNDKDSIKLFVESVREDAPINYQLMCKLKGKVGCDQIADFMNQEEFQPIEKTLDKQLVGLGS